jgi:CheY-like chemotaxis protein
MPQSIFVKVVGFTDVERHALNTVFRLSEAHPCNYMLWVEDAPEPPQLVLLDGQSYEAGIELGMQRPDTTRLVWVGEDPPEPMWRTFPRPISWPEVVRAMDELFMPPQAATDIEFDIGDASGWPDTNPPEIVVEPEAPKPRALIATSRLDERLYLRARLALHGMTVADEAETAAQVLELLRGPQQYRVALVDFGLGDNEGWNFIRDMQKSAAPASHLVVLKQDLSVMERMRARMAGVGTMLAKPTDPVRLQGVLQKL